MIILTNELIKNISLLCAINSPATPVQVDKMQARCQAFFTNCITAEKKTFDACVMKRNENYIDYKYEN